MKRIVIGLVALAMLVVPMTASAGSIWGLVKNSGLKDLPANGYTIEVKGVNIRAYVFEVKEMKSVCISVWGDGSQTLQCKTYKEIGITEK